MKESLLERDRLSARARSTRKDALLGIDRARRRTRSTHPDVRHPVSPVRILLPSWNAGGRSAGQARRATLITGGGAKRSSSTSGERDDPVPAAPERGDGSRPPPWDRLRRGAEAPRRPPGRARSRSGLRAPGHRRTTSGARAPTLRHARPSARKGRYVHDGAARAARSAVLGLRLGSNETIPFESRSPVSGTRPSSETGRRRCASASAASSRSTAQTCAGNRRSNRPPGPCRPRPAALEARRIDRRGAWRRPSGPAPATAAGIGLSRERGPRRPDPSRDRASGGDPRTSPESPRAGGAPRARSRSARAGGLGLEALEDASTSARAVTPPVAPGIPSSVTPR